MEGKGCSLLTGAENQDGLVKSPPSMVMAEKPGELMKLNAPLKSPLKEADPPVVHREEDSIQDQNQHTTSPENLQHCKTPQENFQQKFRRFRYEDGGGPQQVLHQLRELSRRWLDPEVNTKDQIVELLVQEQFQAILPEELRALSQRQKTEDQING